jgi:hypothetical protein
MTDQPPPVRVTCTHCHGTGITSRTKRRGECEARWWDMTSEPYKEWTCGRPLTPGQQYCAEHARQIAWLAGRQ